MFAPTVVKNLRPLETMFCYLVFFRYNRAKVLKGKVQGDFLFSFFHLSISLLIDMPKSFTSGFRTNCVDMAGGWEEVGRAKGGTASGTELGK
jgi:hypothetical protein